MELSARQKKILRQRDEREAKAEDRFWTYFDRDFVPGKDDGEPPTGANW